MSLNDEIQKMVNEQQQKDDARNRSSSEEDKKIASFNALFNACVDQYIAPVFTEAVESLKKADLPASWEKGDDLSGSNFPSQKAFATLRVKTQSITFTSNKFKGQIVVSASAVLIPGQPPIHDVKPETIYMTDLTRVKVEQFIKPVIAFAIKYR